MNSGGLDKRGRALEDEFFHRVDKQLIEQLKQRLAAEAQRDALKEACNFADDALLDALVESGMSAETLLALTLVPLVRVAWADGRMEAQEREAILKAAEESNCQVGSIAHDLLKSWLDEAPADSLYQTWQDYVSGLNDALSADAKDKLKSQVVTQAESVAKAAGGLLGVASISAQEQAVLDQVAAVFA